MKSVFISLLALSVLCLCKGQSVTLTQSNWTVMMGDSWMVIFHAPWCPACRSTMPAWDEFSKMAEDIHVRIAHVDVTTSPALTGVFLISHLPTIIHVNEGLVRSYTGGRRTAELVDFVKMKKWADVEPIPWYYSPSSLHMRALGYLLQLSVFVRDCHSYLTDQIGFPSWLAYVALGVTTLLIGVSVGLICVLICDFFCPPRPQIKLLLGGKPEPPGRAVDSDLDEDSDVIEDGEPQDSGGDDTNVGHAPSGAGDDEAKDGGSVEDEGEENEEETAQEAKEEEKEEAKEEEKEEEAKEEEQRRGRRARRRKE